MRSQRQDSGRPNREKPRSGVTREDARTHCCLTPMVSDTFSRFMVQRRALVQPAVLARHCGTLAQPSGSGRAQYQRLRGLEIAFIRPLELAFGKLRRKVVVGIPQRHVNIPGLRVGIDERPKWQWPRCRASERRELDSIHSGRLTGHSFRLTRARRVRAPRAYARPAEPASRSSRCRSGARTRPP